jgi:hypothetical protein
MFDDVVERLLRDTVEHYLCIWRNLAITVDGYLHVEQRCARRGGLRELLQEFPKVHFRECGRTELHQHGAHFG